MEETKNDEQVAYSFASGLTMPFLAPYANEGKSISISNGAAVGDVQTILSDTADLMSTFQTSLKNEADNLHSISNRYEQADQEGKQVMQGGK